MLTSSQVAGGVRGITLYFFALIASLTFGRMPSMLPCLPRMSPISPVVPHVLSLKTYPITGPQTSTSKLAMGPTNEFRRSLTR